MPCSDHNRTYIFKADTVKIPPECLRCHKPVELVDDKYPSDWRLVKLIIGMDENKEPIKCERYLCPECKAFLDEINQASFSIKGVKSNEG